MKTCNCHLLKKKKTLVHSHLDLHHGAPGVDFLPDLTHVQRVAVAAGARVGVLEPE